MFLQAGPHRPASRDLVEARLARQRSALEASCLKLSSLGGGDVRRGDVLCVGCKLFKMSTIWFALLCGQLAVNLLLLGKPCLGCESLPVFKFHAAAASRCPS